jgi:hypothetical protein
MRNEKNQVKKKRETQITPQGKQIPIPQRNNFFRNFTTAEIILYSRGIITFRDVEVTKSTNLGVRQNLRHDFGLLRARMDHHYSPEAMTSKIPSDFFAVAVLSIGKTCVHPVQIVIEECDFEILPRQQVDGGCTRLSELSIAEALPEPRDAIFAIVENKHRPRLWDIEGH